MDRGLVHIYCGDGKGKTTAALGLALRACGRGKKVLMLQFLKGHDTGELKSIEHIPNFEVIKGPEKIKFLSAMDEKEKSEARDMYGKLFEKATKKADEYDMLILDEAIGAVGGGIIDKNRLVDFIKNKPKKLELVLTGRNPDSELMALADYISEIKKVRHPYDKGITARKGIEL